MKKFFIILVIFIIALGGGYYLAKYYRSKNESTNSTKVTAANYKEPFLWGIHNNPSAVRNYSLEFWRKQMKLVKELNAPWIRLPLDEKAIDNLVLYDEMIKEANTNYDAQVYLLLSSSQPILELKDPHADGYKMGDAVSKQFKGTVKYYQLMSEQGSTALKGGEYSGETEADYDMAKYEIVRKWMKGASEAIRKNDPGAYIVINDQWTHVAYFDMLIRDKVEFDIIGWNWFGDMGMMGERKLANGTLLVDKLQSFNKPIILTEVNDRPGKKGMNETHQAEFIQNMADWAYKTGYIKGFIIHELLDLKPTDTRPGDFYGLVEYKKSSDGGYTIGDKKKAFETYKEILQKYTQGQ